MKRKSPITNSAAGPVQVSKIRSKYTKKIIRRHHTLLKQRAQLETQLEEGEDAGKRAELTAIDQEISSNGGLKRYQQASISGQDRDRGGDSSKVLVQWLKESPTSKATGLRLLEVGSLSPENEVARSGIFKEIDRIDLHSQHPLIREVDFLKYPIPHDDKDRFDVISLSLVVNYVATPADRGLMLRRTAKLLSQTTAGSGPGLFLVLPAPCTNNSRYFTEERLSDMMTSIGYRLVHRKETPRLIYWYYQLTTRTTNPTAFKKELLNDGKTRNNFTITLPSSN